MGRTSKTFNEEGRGTDLFLINAVGIGWWNHLPGITFPYLTGWKAIDFEGTQSGLTMTGGCTEQPSWNAGISDWDLSG